jgi:hypothetical protein
MHSSDYVWISLLQEEAVRPKFLCLIPLLLCLGSIERALAFEADGQPHGSSSFSIDKHQTIEAWASSKGGGAIHIRIKLSNGARFSRLNMATDVHLFDKEKNELLRYNAHVSCPASLGKRDQYRYYDFDVTVKPAIWHDAATVVVDGGKARPAAKPIVPTVVFQRS